MDGSQWVEKLNNASGTLTGWLNDLLSSEAASAGGAETVLLILLMSFCLGHLIGWVYIYTHTGLSYSRAFTASLVVLPPIVAVTMLVMTDNIVIAFGLFAVLAIVRFRNVVKDTRDTSFVLASIITGLAVGTMRFSLAVVGCGFILLIYIYLYFAAFGARNQFDTVLSLRWLGPGDASPIIKPVLVRHASRSYLVNQRRTGPESMTMSYHVLMRNPYLSDELLKDLHSIEGVSDASVYQYEEESEI